MADVYLPGRYSLRLESICIIVDTSGSIGAEELSQALAEIRAVAEQTQPETLRVLAADTRVVSDEEVDWDSPLNLTFDGGGGTDMRVPLEHVEQYNPAAVVLITDGYTPWPTSEPPYNLIVCCTTSVEVPIGRVVRLR
jgi:predicted metal-dependent peptidase